MITESTLYKVLMILLISILVVSCTIMPPKEVNKSEINKSISEGDFVIIKTINDETLEFRVIKVSSTEMHGHDIVVNFSSIESIQKVEKNVKLESFYRDLFRWGLGIAIWATIL